LRKPLTIQEGMGVKVRDRPRLIMVMSVPFKWERIGMKDPTVSLERQAG
jgi:hypothetical protein